MKWGLFIFFGLFILSCGDSATKKYEYVTAHVDSTQHTHMYKGYYKLNVFYTFSLNEKPVHGVFTHKFEMAYTAKYEAGDSILVRYEKDKPEERTIKKITYKKRKIKL